MWPEILDDGSTVFMPIGEPVWSEVLDGGSTVFMRIGELCVVGRDWMVG